MNSCKLGADPGPGRIGTLRNLLENHFENHLENPKPKKKHIFRYVRRGQHGLRACGCSAAKPQFPQVQGGATPVSRKKNLYSK